MNILVVEDSQASALLLEKILVKSGHTVMLAENGRKAWEHMQKTHFRLVITDWMMPEMSGIELCQKIRSSDLLTSYTYIILLTAKGETDDSVEGLAAGADDFIIKPFNPQELNARIRSGKRIIDLEDRFRNTSNQLIQSEKMGSVGQLAAGIAHEINNPNGFVSSNIQTLKDYRADILEVIHAYRRAMKGAAEGAPNAKDLINAAVELDHKNDINFIMHDFEELITDCEEGTERIKKIVSDMKDFSDPGDNKPVKTCINKCIETTVSVVWNELKFKVQLMREYGEIPDIECIPQHLNQVFMNLLVNAGHAIKDTGKIRITTKPHSDGVKITITDSGCGIAPDHLNKIFDPFFTTKPVGDGTGLGLHLVYNIIQKHGGTISVDSKLDHGTTFTIILPGSFSHETADTSDH